MNLVRIGLVALIAFGLVGLFLTPSRAQEAPAPAPTPDAQQSDRPWAVGVSAEEQATAFALLGQGNDEFGELRYAQALAKYREALTHWDHPAIRFNIAVCLINLQNPLEAKQNLTLALKYGEEALGPDLYRQATTYEVLLNGQITHVTISCKEPDAVISLDGKKLFVAPGTAELDLLPGDHLVVAKKPGFLTASETLDLRPGKAFALDVRLIALKAATTTVVVRRWSWWKPWAIVGGGAVVAGIGALAYAASSSNMDSYDARIARYCPMGCDAARADELGVADTLSRANDQKIVAYSMLSLGTAVLASGIVGVVLNRPQTRVEVNVNGPRGPLPSGTVSVGWTF